jgi:hypothetical protein
MLYTALMRRFPRIYDNRQLYTAAGKQLHKRADGQALTAADMMAKPWASSQDAGFGHSVMSRLKDRWHVHAAAAKHPAQWLTDTYGEIPTHTSRGRHIYRKTDTHSEG